MDKLSINEEQKFGIEIEYIGLSIPTTLKILKDESLYYEGWIVKKEETIAVDIDIKYAAEINSPHMSNNVYDIHNIKKVCNLLYDNNAMTNFECGAHIHFDGRRLNIEDVSYLQNLLLLTIAYEDVIYRYSAGEDKMLRDGHETNARPIGSNVSIDYLEKYFYNPVKRSTFEKYIIPTFNRSYGINLSNLNTNTNNGKNTIEFRIPNGTINPEIWLNNINTFGLMIEKSLSMSKEERDSLFQKILDTHHEPFDMLTENDDKAIEFISFIKKCDEDITRFMKQYKKQVNKRYYMI